MPRIRTLKPEFFTSEDIVALSPLARLYFQACWCEADREGRMVWKPGTMKLRYFPADKCDIDKIAAEVTDAGLVCLYAVEGKTYAHIPTFKRHQYINPKESESKLPAPDGENVTRHDASATRQHASQSDTDRSNQDLTGVIFPSSVPTKGGVGEKADPEFDEWYSAYPRHEAKGAARKAYSTALKKTDHATLLAGAKRLAANPPSDPKFIPLPASWLNAERWADEPARNQAGTGATASSAGPVVSDIDSQWRARLRAYKPRGFWSPNWGNRPEEGNRDIPPHVYAEWRDGQLGSAA